MVAPPQVTRAEFDEMKAQAAHTQRMVQDLHDAMMVPQPGQEKSLLERMALVTINVENGAHTMRRLGSFARAGMLLLAFLAAVGISVRFGVSLEGVGE